MPADLADLRDAALNAAKQSPVADDVTDIALEPARDDDGDEFLRVVVHVRSLETANEHDIDELADSIEGVLSALDERFPSVRLAEAA